MDDAEQEWRAHGTQIWRIEADAEKNQQEVLTTTNQIEEAVMKNNCIFTKKWELTHEQIKHWADEHQLLKTCIIELESLSGLQQTALQSCQNQIAGLEETVTQLVTVVKKLEKTVCQCHNRLLLPGPHYTEGEEEVVMDLEEEEDDEDGLEYETDAPLRDSYTTPPSTRGCSKPSPASSRSPILEDLDPEINTVLHTAEIEAHIESFLEEVEEDLELNDLPPLGNVTPLPIPVPNPIIPGFVPFAVSTGQCCVPPKSLLQKVYHPYKNPIG